MFLLHTQYKSSSVFLQIITNLKRIICVRMGQGRRSIFTIFKVFLLIMLMVICLLFIYSPHYHYINLRQHIGQWNSGRKNGNQTKMDQQQQNPRAAYDTNLPNTNNNDKTGQKGTAKEVSSKKGKLTECRLPRVDPWDPVLMEHISTKYCELARSYKECTTKDMTEITKLKDGMIQVNAALLKEGTICEFRCLYNKNDFEITMGQWQNVTAQPECDIVEVQCKENAKNDAAIFYSFLHAQIYHKREQMATISTTTVEPRFGVDVEWRPELDENGQENAAPEPNRPPDVHVLILDSISHTMFMRSLPKTAMWLRERMGAIPFPHLNKNGKNSRPNAFAMFMGLMVWPIEANPMGDAYKPPRDIDALRWVYLDNEPFIGFEYQKRGYRTMMAEDWARGTFNWPNYYGFQKQPTDHYMRPFHIRSEKMDDANKTLTNNLYKRSCKDYHHYVLDYLGQFIDAYEEVPKFSVNWFTDAAHNSPNGAFWIDDDFYEFFRSYEKKMDNAFLFVMADHGLRFGSIRDTKPGEVEDNNPALFVVVPLHLRWNRQLMGNLRENALQLVSHFDVHATLVDIAREGSNWTHQKSSNFDGPSVDLQSVAPFGSPLHYRFDPTVPRHCGTLHIPFEYCLCQFHKKNETEMDPALANELAQIMVDTMNWDLQRGNATKLCYPLSLNAESSLAVEMLEFEPEKGVNLFQVTYETVPGNGRFWGYIQLEDRQNATNAYNLITTKFPRLNEYGEQAKCVDEDKHLLAPYCYCRDYNPPTTMPPLPPSTTTPPSTTMAPTTKPTMTMTTTISATGSDSDAPNININLPLMLHQGPDGQIYLAETEMEDGNAAATDDALTQLLTNKNKTALAAILHKTLGHMKPEEKAKQIDELMKQVNAN